MYLEILYKYESLLSALVDAMSDKQNLEKLNDFPAWRDAIPEEIENE